MKKQVMFFLLAVICLGPTLIPLPGCTPDQFVQGFVTLAKIPVVVPVDVKAETDPKNPALFGFVAVIGNKGWDDATKVFAVRMVVTAYGLPGKANPFVTEWTYNWPGLSHPVPGTHGTGVPIGPLQSTQVLLSDFPRGSGAQYTVYVVVDEDQSAFGGANAGMNNLTWMGPGL